MRRSLCSCSYTLSPFNEMKNHLADADPHSASKALKEHSSSFLHSREKARCPLMIEHCPINQPFRLVRPRFWKGNLGKKVFFSNPPPPSCDPHTLLSVFTLSRSDNEEEDLNLADEAATFAAQSIRALCRNDFRISRPSHASRHRGIEMRKCIHHLLASLPTPRPITFTLFSEPWKEQTQSGDLMLSHKSSKVNFPPTMNTKRRVVCGAVRSGSIVSCSKLTGV